MAVILRFVNDEGKVVERFLGLQHVESCTAIALKDSLVGMLSSHNLSISMLHGQGYDGASNMRGEFNGVQKLIRDENPYAFYVHCFAHQLQPVVVAVSTSSADIADFFNYVPLIVNNVGASCMRKDVLLAKHHDVLLEKIENGEIMTGSGLNQESSLARPGDTRWGSHLKTLLRILVMWESIIDVLEIVKKDSIKPTCNGGALGLIGKMESFDFVFILHLMIELLSMTDILSRALQGKDQDMVEAMHLITDVKDGLQDMRNNGWEPLLRKVKTFCEKNEIEVPDMDKKINVRGTSRRRKQKVTNKHYYHVEIFLVAIDAILTELISLELLVCMACFNPRNNFSNFDVDKLARLAEIYAEDFDIGDLIVLPNQLRQFINRARRTPDFLGCTELGKVAEIMVKNNMHTSYKLVYRLIELTLILPVATASIERIFSAMSIIKIDLRNKMGDEWLNDLMICYNEKEIFGKIGNEKIKKRFQEMKKRGMLLPKKLVGRHCSCAAAGVAGLSYRAVIAHVPLPELQAFDMEMQTTRLAATPASARTSPPPSTPALPAAEHAGCRAKNAGTATAAVPARQRATPSGLARWLPAEAYASQPSLARHRREDECRCYEMYCCVRVLYGESVRREDGCISNDFDVNKFEQEEKEQEEEDRIGDVISSDSDDSDDEQGEHQFKETKRELDKMVNVAGKAWLEAQIKQKAQWAFAYDEGGFR
ncbi:uncharacterized protein [Miscanthus floridulus]|uniref:uncharacterized protein n=1 Tax=Miscanthus floridulus TaxID=154761 RepID=UPI0034597517